MDDPTAHEGESLRATRFYVDLMLTLSEDDVHGAEAVDLLRSLWDGQQSVPTIGASSVPDVDAKLTAWATIAEALAKMVAAERRDSGRADCSLSDVWRDLQLAICADDAVDRDGARDA
jgi:hypothetical protein